MSENGETKPMNGANGTSNAGAADVDNSAHPTTPYPDAEDYFDLNPAPKFLPEYKQRVREFISKHASPSSSSPRPIALVTSGGTTVPLENQTVRFIDNFSAGTRGATSAEYFLLHGYAVIFLHRQFSLLPYSRHFSHTKQTCFLDFMSEEHDDVQGDEVVEGGGMRFGRVIVNDRFQKQMLPVLRAYNRAKDEDTLLLLDFVSINEYLWCLREIARLMQPASERAVFYLAAAVSDFFVPRNRMVEHKIQSGEEFNTSAAAASAAHAHGHDEVPAARMHDQSLVIDLDPVPKFLKRLVDRWAPSAMIVSFKLETDPAILTAKAQHALDKYAHHLVIGNLLSTRKWEVVFVSRAEGERWIRVPRLQRSTSKSGVEALVGRAAVARGTAALAAVVESLSAADSAAARDYPAAAAGADASAIADGDGDDSPEPRVEIERLIIPEVKRLHLKHMAAVRAGAKDGAPPE